MHILLTNDDGIYAEGINCIYKELKKIGQVTVIAPDREKSSVGHGITLSKPLSFKKVFKKKQLFGYAISGTPADCVKFGVKIILKKKPDLIVSGINLGCNDGCSIFYSGTVAAAREGAMLGVPSLALSLATFVDPDFTYSSKFGAKLAKFIIKNGLPKGTFLNVNIPNKKTTQIKGVKLTQQCTEPIHTEFVDIFPPKKDIKNKKSDPLLKEHYWMTGKMPPMNEDLTVDSYALSKDYVTVTPVHCDATDYSYIDKIKKIKII